MKHPIKAIKIDPHNRTITEATFDEGSLQSIYDNLSNEFVRCHIFEVYSPGPHVNMLLDEEGRLKKNKRFRLSWGWNNAQDFCGPALIIGPSSGEHFTDTVLSIEQVNKIIIWEQ